MIPSKMLAALVALTVAAAVSAVDAPAPAPQAERAGAVDVLQAEPAVRAPISAAPARKAKAGQAAAERAPGSGALDRLDLDPTQITGNRELPKVMVIVPWKRSDIGDLAGRPVNSLIDEVLQPLDREVFRREVAYYDALSPDRPRAETSVKAPASVSGAEK
ncbi:MAG: hypothetical protein WCH32_07055 [Pseudomonadota bacterium]